MNAQLYAMIDAEIAVRNAMVQNSQDNATYAVLHTMQRKLLKMVRAMEASIEQDAKSDCLANYE